MRIPEPEASAPVILRSPTRQSRCGDGAAAGPKNLLHIP